MKPVRRQRPYYVGVDLGGTKILAAVLDERGKLISREKKSTKSELGQAVVLQRVEECVHEALAAAALPHTAIAGLGIGVPGLVDSKGEIVRIAPKLDWHHVPLARLLRQRLNIPVTVVNDVQAGTLGVGEYGAGRGLKSFVCMFIGTGLGGGIVIDGQLYRGSTGMAGEVGHMTVIPADGPKCGCGNRGCLEAVVSRSAIVRRIVREIKDGRKSVVKQLCDGDLTRIRSRILSTAYRQGDGLVREVIHEVCEYTGIGAAILINALNPQAVILGGGVIEALGDRMLPRITKAAWAHVIAPSRERIRIKDTGLGDDAGILGAALAARRRHT